MPRATCPTSTTTACHGRANTPDSTSGPGELPQLLEFLGAGATEEALRAMEELADLTRPSVGSATLAAEATPAVDVDDEAADGVDLERSPTSAV